MMEINIFSVYPSRQVNVATWFLVLPIDIANPYRLSSDIYREREKERERHMSSFWHHILAISPAVCRNGSQWFIEIYRMGDNRKTVNTSTTPHICGTENARKTMLCEFIVMIWVLVSNKSYRYQHSFGLFYRNPTILETVSTCSMLPVNGSTRENFCFYWRLYSTIDDVVHRTEP